MRWLSMSIRPVWIPELCTHGTVWAPRASRGLFRSWTPLCQKPCGSMRSGPSLTPGRHGLALGRPRPVTEQCSLLRAPSGPGQQARLGRRGLSSQPPAGSILEPSVRPRAPSTLNSSTGEVGKPYGSCPAWGLGGLLEGTELDLGQAQSSMRVLARGGLLPRQVSGGRMSAGMSPEALRTF